MNYCFTEQVTTRSILEPWVIQTYLHSRFYNILIILIKVISVQSILRYGIHSDFFSLLNIVMFFYFELFIVYRYFLFKHRIKQLYGDNRVREMCLTENMIEVKDAFSTTQIKINEISYIRETRWFIFGYKGTRKIFYIYKRDIEPHTRNEIQKYFQFIKTKINQ